MSAETKVSSIPRRPIRLSYHMPMTKDEHEALYRLAQVPVRVQLYEEGPIQELTGRAFGPATDSQVVGDIVVTTVTWVGMDNPPDELMAVIGYKETARRRPNTSYHGMGVRLVGVPR